MIKKSFVITNRQLEWLASVAATHEIGMQEQMRRIFDYLIANGLPTSSPFTTAPPPPANVESTPVLIEKIAPDKEGTTIVRIWKSTHRLLNEFCNRHKVTQIQLLHQILSAPEDVILSLLLGEYDPASKEEIKPRRAIDDIDPDCEHLSVEQFLYDYCIYSPASNVEGSAVYSSYNYYCKEIDLEPVDPGVFRAHLIDRGFMPGGIGSKLYQGLALRPKAHAVMMGEVQGVYLDDGEDG